MSLQPIFEMSPQAEYIGLRYIGRVSKVVKHERGYVQAFSFRSRSRLMKKISQISKHHLPLFVTLTYHENYPVEFKEYKYHLHKFFIYLRRECPNMGAIWKLEFQARGAAHFHLLLFGCDYEYVRLRIPVIWNDIVAQGDDVHLLWHLGELDSTVPCVQEIRSWRGVRSYASKYLSKLDETTERSGRYWGVRGNVPFSPLIAMRIDIRTALEFRRAFRRKSGMTFKRFGFWAYGSHVDWLLYMSMLEDYYYALDMPEQPPKRYDLTAAPPPDAYSCF